MKCRIEIFICWSALVFLAIVGLGRADDSQPATSNIDLQTLEQADKSESQWPSSPENAIDSQTPRQAFWHLFIIVSSAVALGLCMIFTGIVQWRRNQNQKEAPLFPTAEMSHQPFPVVSSMEEAPMIEGEPLKVNRKNKPSEKSAQRRAA